MYSHSVKRYHIGLLLGLIFGVLLALAPWATERYARHKISTRYPDVRVEKVEPKWGHVLLHNVTFDRGWVKGTLDLVEVPWEETEEILISGGTISADLDQRPAKTSGGSKKKVAGGSLKGTVTRGGVTAAFTDLGFSNDGVGVPEVVIDHPKFGEIIAKDVHYDFTTIAIEEITGKLPAFAGHELGDTKLHRLRINAQDEVAWIYHADIPAIGVYATGLTFARQDDQVLAFHFEEIQVQDKRLSTTPITLSGINLEVNPETGVVTLFRNGFVVLTANVKTRHMMGEASCRTWVDLLPVELQGNALKELAPGFTGKFSFELSTQPKVSLAFDNTCKATCDGATIKSLRWAFDYPIRKVDGTEGTRRIGPNVPASWTRLGEVSRHVITALTIMEDPGFFSHKGFIRQAIENSIRDDLQAGKFIRGGSTLSMQLAKNLWLRHEKTLGRKVQEGFLTMALESCLSKEEILALYLNVVEFGRGLYGIGPASRSYFKVSPSELTPEQAFYLVWILPRPRTAPPPNDATMGRIRKLMGVFIKDGRIPDILGEDEPIGPIDWAPAP